MLLPCTKRNKITELLLGGSDYMMYQHYTSWTIILVNYDRYKLRFLTSFHIVFLHEWTVNIQKTQMRRWLHVCCMDTNLIYYHSYSNFWKLLRCLLTVMYPKRRVCYSRNIKFKESGMAMKHEASRV